jgi:hypothetical protein
MKKKSKLNLIFDLSHTCLIHLLFVYILDKFIPIKKELSELYFSFIFLLKNRIKVIFILKKYLIQSLLNLLKYFENISMIFILDYKG